MYRRIAALLLSCLVAGCSSLLPKSKEVTASPWQTYQDAQDTFDKIIPGQTTIADLRLMSLDPGSNANIAILNYADVMRKFLLNQSFSINDLDDGVRQCVLRSSAWATSYSTSSASTARRIPRAGASTGSSSSRMTSSCTSSPAASR
ncbi:MAG: hypothetical protein E6H57_00825 [Betaproteobacteria bacterium]|nr:MAG: hypothetical protein E6H57_00825 [Betaproteobacteria bacterium]